MSYKFPLWRCGECGAVWFDPALEPAHDNRCRLVYFRSGDGLVPCLGKVTRFVGVDCDMFSFMYHDSLAL